MIILGSTGSIGVQALQIIKSQNLNIEVLCAGDNIALLNAQIAEFRPKIVVIKDRAKKDLVKGAKVVLCGDEGIIKALNIASSDFVLNALVGFSGVRPSLEAIRLGKRLALANKESLVVAGFLIDSADLARIIPVDSEHFALKELLDSMLGNSSLGASLALGGNFGEQQTHKSSFIPKISSKYKTSTAIRRICEQSEAINTRICDSNQSDSNKSQDFCDSKNDSNQSARSATERSVVGGGGGSCEGGARGATSQFKPPPPPSKETRDRRLGELNADLSAQRREEIDSTNSQNLQGGWLLRNARKSFGLPRRFCESARNDNFLDSSHPTLPQNDNMELDSAPQNNFTNRVKKMIITASGGAFRDLPLNQIPRQNAESALKHPNWAMGRKITIDSATMINKVFEILEAKWLFGGRFCDFANFSQSAESSSDFAESTPNIDAVIERTSTLHAIIQMQNNALLAHFSANDMRLPIASALLGAKAQNLAFVKELDLMDLNVRFEKIDCNRYPLWVLKDEVLKRPKIGAIINAANDILVERFLQNQIYFGDISCGIFAVLDKFGAESMQNIDEILEINAKIKDFLSRFKGFRH